MEPIENFSFNSLPKELIPIIFDNIESYNDRLTCAAVCTLWRTAINTPEFEQVKEEFLITKFLPKHPRPLIQDLGGAQKVLSFPVLDIEPLETYSETIRIDFIKPEHLLSLKSSIVTGSDEYYGRRFISVGYKVASIAPPLFTNYVITFSQICNGDDSNWTSVGDSPFFNCKEGCSYSDNQPELATLISRGSVTITTEGSEKVEVFFGLH